MDYKKKYEELLARLQEAKENAYKTDERYCCVIDSIVPELKESEDEKTRRVLREIVLQWKNGHQAWCSDNKEIDAILAWLKNQGEKGTKGNEREIPFATWSEEDENIRQWIISDIDKLLALKKKSFIIADKEINWIKSIKDRVGCETNCTTTNEWSKEDYNEIETIACHLDNTDNEGMAEVLRNIRDKYYHVIPQTTWKPSDEQIKVCKEVYADLLSAKGFDVGTINSELNRLEEQLKKLKS